MRSLIALIALGSLAACSDGRLLNITSDGTPDEFAILPGKPLETPPSYADLPAPTPGAANLTDPTPEADAALALGGRPGAGVSSGGLVNYASRFGRDPEIRADLAAADARFRAENEGRFLERLFNVNVYFDAYEPFELDQYREYERFRRAGATVPAAPPDPAR